MALQKSVTSDSGAVATYHHVSEVNFRKGFGTEVVVKSFVSKAARDDDKTQLFLGGHVFEDATEGLSVAEAYAALKTLDAWAGSSDV